MLDQVPNHEDIWGKGGLFPSIRIVGNGRMTVVSFTQHPLHFQG